MLVIISDLHLTDGTTADTVMDPAFDRFQEILMELARAASWRDDQTYRPIKRIDLLLLGDILDVLRSTYWDGVKARPWDKIDHAGQSADLVDALEHITDNMLVNNQKTFEIMRGWSCGKAITIPAAAAGGDLAKTGTQDIDVAIYYMVGNHDWFWHVQGEGFERIRRKICDALGLANGPGPFPHSPFESAEIGRIQQAHKVLARHGDIYDAFNFNHQGQKVKDYHYNPKDRDYAALGDAIVIDIINGFPLAVSLLEDELPVGFREEILEIGNVRPRLLTPVWLQNLINRHGVPDEAAKKIRKSWNGCVDNMMKNTFIRQQDNWWNPFDTVDKIEAILKFANYLPFPSIMEIVELVYEYLWDGDVSYAKHIPSENAFESKKPGAPGTADAPDGYIANYFVYGHTHHHEIVPLDNTDNGLLVPPFDRWYFNSGTWHPLYDRAEFGEGAFIRHKVFTYLAFYKEDERKGRRYETWSGTLYDLPEAQALEDFYPTPTGGEK